jgi:PAS domain S-box-containing protein
MNELTNKNKKHFYNYYEKGNDVKRLSYLLLIFAIILCPLFASIFRIIGSPIIFFYCVLSATIIFPLIIFLENKIKFLNGKLPALYYVYFQLMTLMTLHDLFQKSFSSLELLYFFVLFSFLNFALQRFTYSFIYLIITFSSHLILQYFFKVENGIFVQTTILILCIGIFSLVIYASRNKMIDSIEDHNLYLKKIVNNLGSGIVLFQIQNDLIEIIDINKTTLLISIDDGFEKKFNSFFSFEERVYLENMSEEQIFIKEIYIDNDSIQEIKINKLLLKNGNYFVTIFNDISDKVKEQNKILLNEKKYRNLFYRNQTGVFTLNLKGDIIESNPAFLKIFDVLNIEGFNLFQSKEEWKKIRELVLSNEIISNYNYIFKKEFDEQLFLVINFYFDQEQKLIEGNIIDVTELTLNSKALEEKENKYRLIYEESNDSILLLDDDRIIDINNQGLKLFETTFKDVFEKSLWDYSYNQTPELKKELEQYFFILKEQKQVKFTWMFFSKNRVIETTLSIAEITIGEDKFYQCVIHDETERNKYLNSLEQTKKTFESILENTPEGFLIIQNKKTVYANKEFYEIFQLNNNDEIQFNESFFGSNFIKIVKLIEENKQEKQRKQKQIQFFINGKTIDIDITIVSIIFDDETAQLIIFKDISFQNKLSKEQLRAELAEETSKRLVKEIEERKLVEFKLETEYLRTKAIFDSSENTLLLTLTPDLKISTYNQHSKTYFEKQTNKNLDKNTDFELYFEQIISSIKLRFFKFLISSIKKGKSYQLQLKFININNEKKWLEIYLNPIKNLEGKVSEISLVAHDITEKKNNERKVLLSLKEKEVLLKEVHHRVKNNLQIISSILNLQSSYVNDKKTLEIIEESRHRIRSMAIIHENLYQNTNFSSINFKNYSRELIRNLISSYHFDTKTDVKIKEKVEKIELSLDQAIPCGLIINELITNSLKYAFSEVKKGNIYLELSELDNKIKLVVGDDGIGLPKNFDINHTETLGLQLVVTLVEQLDGNIKLEKTKGIKYFITFEKQKL